jgi:hypothetical protein
MEQICKTTTRYAAIAVDELQDYAGTDTVAREHLTSLRERTDFLYDNDFFCVNNDLLLFLTSNTVFSCLATPSNLVSA